MDKKNKSLGDILDKIEEILLVVMFAVMVLVIFGQVIMRYVFNNSLSWSEELGKFLFVWLSWIGISIGEKRNEHIKITMFIDKMSERGRLICNILSEIVVFFISVITAYYGVLLCISQRNIAFAGIRISMTWGYLAVTVGCILMCIRCLLQIKTFFDELKGVDVK